MAIGVSPCVRVSVYSVDLKPRAPDVSTQHPHVRDRLIPTTETVLGDSRNHRALETNVLVTIFIAMIKTIMKRD